MTPSTHFAMMPRLSLVLALAAALAACGGGDDPARTAQRTAAHRAACVAEELAIQANSKISSLDTMRTRVPGSFVNQVFPFARAYFDYAKLRERQAAWADSASSATSAQDSARFAGEAARAAPPRGRPGSIEANAVESYERDYAAAMANPDHPCNQQAVTGEER
jgi:hypothetical protein